MSNALRKIAEHELDRCFHGLSAAACDELATSLVRQWIGNDGNAVIVTPDFHVWFRIKKLDDGQTQVVRDVEPQTFVEHVRKSRVIEDQIPKLLHELNLRQSTDAIRTTEKRSGCGWTRRSPCSSLSWSWMTTSGTATR